MAAWHHRLDGHGFGWTPGVGDGQGGLVCYGLWDRTESDTTEQLNWTDDWLVASFWPMNKYDKPIIDAFEMWCWRRLSRVPWTVKRSNQSILREINAEYSLEGLTLKLKLQYSGHLMWRAESLEKTLMLGKIEGRRKRKWQRVSWWDRIADAMDMNSGKLQETVRHREA